MKKSEMHRSIGIKGAVLVQGNEGMCFIWEMSEEHRVRSVRL